VRASGRARSPTRERCDPSGPGDADARRAIAAEQEWGAPGASVAAEDEWFDGPNASVDIPVGRITVQSVARRKRFGYLRCLVGLTVLVFLVIGVAACGDDDETTTVTV
jgi:hypothetical protein